MIRPFVIKTIGASLRQDVDKATHPDLCPKCGASRSCLKDLLQSSDWQNRGQGWAVCENCSSCKAAMASIIAGLRREAGTSNSFPLGQPTTGQPGPGVTNPAQGPVSNRPECDAGFDHGYKTGFDHAVETVQEWYRPEGGR